MTITEMIGIALGSGGLGAVLTYSLGKRKQNTNDFEVLAEKYKELLDKSENKINELEKKYDILLEKVSKITVTHNKQMSDAREEIQSLRHQLMIFESSHVDIPLPMWMKDTEGKMIFLNSFYEDAFLLPRGYTISDYLGKNDYSVWDESIAKAFIANDKKVIRTKKFIKVIETLDDGQGNKFYAEILKYPRSFNNTIIGISGMVLRTATNKNDL